jgi:SPP1 family predicted phage head-tail adaptor
MKIGKLQHRIAIEQVAEIQDSDGSVIETWSAFANVQASIEPISGQEYFAAQTT